MWIPRGIAGRGAIVLFCLIVCIFAQAGSVFAEHEVNHRYTLQGTVKDSDGNPWTGALVRLTDSVNPEVRTTVDSDGKWTAGLHLHDQNLGDEVLISVPSAGIEVMHVVTFDPTDLINERVANEDLVSGIEATTVVRPGGSITPYLITFVVLLVVAGAGAIIYSLERASAVRTPADPSTPRIPSKRKRSRGAKG